MASCLDIQHRTSNRETDSQRGSAGEPEEDTPARFDERFFPVGLGEFSEEEIPPGRIPSKRDFLWVLPKKVLDFTGKEDTPLPWECEISDQGGMMFFEPSCKGTQCVVRTIDEGYSSFTDGVFHNEKTCPHKWQTAIYKIPDAPPTYDSDDDGE